jgi:hypothetical protein
MASCFGYISHLQAIIYNQLIDLDIVTLACAKMAHANMTMYIKYFELLLTARYIHQNCVCVVPPEDGQVMPETCRGFDF